MLLRVEEGIYFGPSDYEMHNIRVYPSKWKDDSLDNKAKRSLRRMNEMHKSHCNNGYNPTKGGDINSAIAALEKERKCSINGRKGEETGSRIFYTSRVPRRNITYGKRRGENREAKRKEPEPDNTWKLFTDGASSSDGSGAGLMLVNPEGKEYTYALRFEFETTNNEAEYEALIARLCIVKEMQIQELAIFVDFQLVANQVKGLSRNKKADALNKLASMTFSKLAKEVLVEMVPIREYLKEGKRSAKGKETAHQSSTIQDDPREAISKVVHVTMVEVSRTNSGQEHHKGSARRVLQDALGP
ncbi:reverse transcriptase domain-containing protein [Tanacetum coccineum]